MRTTGLKKPLPPGVAIVCGGYTDVIAMHGRGFTNTLRRWARLLDLIVKLLERQQVKKLSCLTAMRRVRNLCSSVQFIDRPPLLFLLCRVAGQSRPDGFLAAHGADALKPYLAQARR